MARQASSGRRTEKLEARKKQKLAAASPFQGQGRLIYGTRVCSPRSPDSFKQFLVPGQIHRGIVFILAPLKI